MSGMTPTGRWRYRVEHRWFKDDVLVLQIEERYLYTYLSGGCVDAEYATRWRDAQPTDIINVSVTPADPR